MRKFSITITKVLIFTLFITLTMITSLLGLYNYVERRDAMKDELINSAEQIAERLRINLASSFYDMDIPQIEAIIRSEMKNRNLYAVTLREPDGRPFYFASRDEKWEFSNVKADSTPNTKYYIMEIRDIVFEDEKIGTARVFLTKVFLTTAMASLLRDTFMALFLIDIVVIIILFIVLRFVLIRPIRELQKYSNEIGPDNLDADRPGAIFFGELLDLKSSLYRMVVSLKQLIENLEENDKELREFNEKLEHRVRERTAEVDEKNTKLSRVNFELEKTLDELKQSQDQLIQSEKMAALGHLIAGVAHEINTPMGAIRASADNVSDALSEALKLLPGLFQRLPDVLQEDFFALVEKSLGKDTALSAREERKLRRKLTRILEEHEIEDADDAADTLTDMGIYDDVAPFLGLLRHSEGGLILRMAYDLSGLQRGTRNIITATERASKIVFALKSYARFDSGGESVPSDLSESIETVLTLYHNLLKHGIEVVRNYEELPPVPCYPDELNQVWTNLAHNAIQAMESRGRLEIDVRQRDEWAVVTVTDSGKGIPDEIKERIFEPFFTTKPAGEGSGLGLDIVKKIIDKHNGRIEVESEPGRTMFSVSLPVSTSIPETDR